MLTKSRKRLFCLAYVASMAAASRRRCSRRSLSLSVWGWKGKMSASASTSAEGRDFAPLQASTSI